MLFQLSHPGTTILSFKSLVKNDCGRGKKKKTGGGEAKNYRFHVFHSPTQLYITSLSMHLSMDTEAPSTVWLLWTLLL